MEEYYETYYQEYRNRSISPKFAIPPQIDIAVSQNHLFVLENEEFFRPEHLKKKGKNLGFKWITLPLLISSIVFVVSIFLWDFDKIWTILLCVFSGAITVVFLLIQIFKGFINFNVQNVMYNCLVIGPDGIFLKKEDKTVFRYWDEFTGYKLNEQTNYGLTSIKIELLEKNEIPYEKKIRTLHFAGYVCQEILLPPIGTKEYLAGRMLMEALLTRMFVTYAKKISRK